MLGTAQCFIEQHQTRIDELLQTAIPKNSHDNPLIEAMSYSLLSGGKRIRPILVYASAQATGIINETTDTFACAIECIHAFSLIHDDLPAMDDDDLRRGLPTCHKAFDEATAILAGDALHTLGFELILEDKEIAPDLALNALKILCRATGTRGMIMGQAIDLNAVGKIPDIAYLQTMHRNKTGALIEASIELGARSAEAGEEDIDALLHYAQALGLAFQVQDDILDVTAETALMGKKQGADERKGKPTYVSLLGLEEAQKKARNLAESAKKALVGFDDRANTLRFLANYAVERVF